MDIRSFLKEINLWTEDKQLIQSFLNSHENEIHDFIRDKWNQYAQTKNIGPQLPILINSDTSGNEPKKLIPELSLDSIDKTSHAGLANNKFEQDLKNKTIILPNGKVNQEYSFVMDTYKIGLEGVGEMWFEGIEDIGLAFDSSSNQLTGKPTLHGDFKLKLKIKRKDWEIGKPVFERQLNLIINPDPKSLWKNIPTALDIEYYKPDSSCSYVKVEAPTNLFGKKKVARKDMVAASQRGRSHAQEGRPRDDDFTLHYIKEHDWYIMSVADGAGSASASRKGSEIACKTVVDVCEQLIKEKTKEFETLIKDFNSERSDERRKKMGDALYGIIGNAVFKAVKNIEEEAKKTNKPLKDYSTTLIASICKKFKFGWFVGSFWVGDGGIGIYNKDTQFLKIMGESDGGEYAGQTRFLTMPEVTQPAELYRRLRFEIVEDFTALILMTDGITDPKFETDANLLKIEKWNGLWEDLSNEVDFLDDNEGSAAQLLSWLDFWSPGNHDDRTIAILY